MAGLETLSVWCGRGGFIYLQQVDDPLCGDWHERFHRDRHHAQAFDQVGQNLRHARELA